MNSLGKSDVLSTASTSWVVSAQCSVGIGSDVSFNESSVFGDLPLALIIFLLAFLDGLLAGDFIRLLSSLKSARRSAILIVVNSSIR